MRERDQGAFVEGGGEVAHRSEVRGSDEGDDALVMDLPLLQIGPEDITRTAPQTGDGTLDDGGRNASVD